MFRLVRIDGSATPIIETSSASRKSAPQRTSKVPQASLVSLSVPPKVDAGAVDLDTRASLSLLFDPHRTWLFDRCQTMTDLTSFTESSHSPKATDLSAIDGLTVLHALSDPVRLDIVRQLAGCTGGSELKCGQLELPVTKSTASHHFKTLYEAGIVSAREQGTSKYI